MSLASHLHDKLALALSPVHLEVFDESFMHNVPAGTESHFRVLVVSEAFEGRGRVDRHRAVHGLLADELARRIHALSVRALTPDEWRAEGAAGFASPKCLGGSKA